MTSWALDIETKTDFKTVRLVGLAQSNAYGLTVTKWCVSKDSGCRMVMAEAKKHDTIFTWNGEGFDYRLLGVNVKELEREGVKLIDGMYLSKLLYPDRYSHSLSSWAKELLGKEEQKLEVDYDHAPISELQTYCARDLDITLKVCKELYERYNKIFPDDHVLRVEQGVRRLVNDTLERGFGFNVEAARALAQEFKVKQTELQIQAFRWLPMAPIPPSKLRYPPKKQVNVDGTLSKLMVKWLDEEIGVCRWNFHNDMSPFRVTFEDDAGLHTWQLPIGKPYKTNFKVGLHNTKEIKAWLMMSRGWEPTMWNTNSEKKKTSPLMFEKTTGDVCPNLAKILTVSQQTELRQYGVLKSRLGVVEGLIERQQEGVIYADADTCGTPTARFRHRGIVNIPRTNSEYGQEMRDLFGPVNPDHYQVGWDAKGLESVMEAHYVHAFDPDYANDLVTGDVHTRNEKKLGFPNRDVAKRFKYAIMYGARPPRLAATLSVSEAQARIWYDQFWITNTGLAELVRHLEREWSANNEKYIIGIDGRRLYTRAQHALLNTLLQGGGAILMKYAFLLANKMIRREYPMDAWPLIRYHDEEQWEASTERVAGIVGTIGVESLECAGRALNLKVPITGSYKVGKTWGSCH